MKHNKYEGLNEEKKEEAMSISSTDTKTDISNEIIDNFQITPKELTDIINLYKERIDKKNKGYETLSSIPLVGTGIISIVLTFSIMTILGDIVNVI